MDKDDFAWLKNILTDDEYSIFREWIIDQGIYISTYGPVCLCPDFSNPKILEIAKKVKAYFDECDKHTKEMLKKKEENLE